MKVSSLVVVVGIVFLVGGGVWMVAGSGGARGGRVPASVSGERTAAAPAPESQEPAALADIGGTEERGRFARTPGARERESSKPTGESLRVLFRDSVTGRPLTPAPVLVTPLRVGADSLVLARQLYPDGFFPERTLEILSHGETFERLPEEDGSIGLSSGVVRVTLPEHYNHTYQNSWNKEVPAFLVDAAFASEITFRGEQQVELKLEFVDQLGNLRTVERVRVRGGNSRSGIHTNVRGRPKVDGSTTLRICPGEIRVQADVDGEPKIDHLFLVSSEQREHTERIEIFDGPPNSRLTVNIDFERRGDAYYFVALEDHARKLMPRATDFIPLRKKRAVFENLEPGRYRPVLREIFGLDGHFAQRWGDVELKRDEWREVSYTYEPEGVAVLKATFEPRFSKHRNKLIRLGLFRAGASLKGRPIKSAPLPEKQPALLAAPSPGSYVVAYSGVFDDSWIELGTQTLTANQVVGRVFQRATSSVRVELERPPALFGEPIRLHLKRRGSSEVWSRKTSADELTFEHVTPGTYEVKATRAIKQEWRTKHRTVSEIENVTVLPHEIGALSLPLIHIPEESGQDEAAGASKAN